MNDEHTAAANAATIAAEQVLADRTDASDWRTHVDKRLDDGAASMKALREDVAENTRKTDSIAESTSELVDLLQSFKGAFSVLDMLAKLARPLGFLAAAIAAFWGLWATIKGAGK